MSNYLYQKQATHLTLRSYYPPWHCCRWAPCSLWTSCSQGWSRPCTPPHNIHQTENVSVFLFYFFRKQKQQNFLQIQQKDTFDCFKGLLYTVVLKSSRIYFSNPSSSRDKPVLSGTTPLGALFYLSPFADFPHQIIVDLLHKNLRHLYCYVILYILNYHNHTRREPPQ